MIINAGLNSGQTPYGQNMELVGNFFSRDIAFKDTDYNGWTPSTTQTTIVDNLVTYGEIRIHGQMDHRHSNGLFVRG